MQSSKRITPATQAAAFSPMEWPISAEGRMPQASHNWASAYSTIRISGSCTEGCCRRRFASVLPSPSASQMSRMS